MNAVQQLLTDHFDIWTAAETEKRSGRGRASGNAANVYGIKRLRDLILELAVRGKLVPQDASDEPASALLQRIQTESATLLAAGKAKTGKTLAAITEYEKPFDLPKGWEWTRLGEIAETIRGVTYTKSDASDSPLPDYVPLLRGNNINRHLNFDNPVFVPKRLLNKDQFIRAGDIVIAMSSGSADLVGKAAQATDDFTGGFGAFCGVVRSKSVEVFGFFGFFFQTPLYRGRAAGHGKGIGINNLQKSALQTLEIPLPPLSEQHRIVAKVDELMALCDQLEAQHIDAADAHEQLVSHLLGTLTQSQSAAEFNTKWQRIAAHFDTLFTTEASIDSLMQTLLQLAVMGKLVAQDANDEPASELLKRIRTEKAKLVAKGKIKKGKPFPKIANEKKESTKPRGWEIINFGEIMELISGQHLNPSEYFEKKENDSIPYITGPADFGDNGPIPTRHTRERRAIASCGDILVTVKGSGVGKTNSVYHDELAISRQLMAVRPILVNINFVDKLLLTLAQLFQDSTVGIAIPGISREDVLHAQIALPPLAEQIRIVAKIDALMEICGQLRTSITTTNQQQKKLADVLAEHAAIG
jgi:type I restriction enzyme S subunit